MVPLSPIQLVQENTQVSNADIHKTESTQDVETGALSTLRDKNDGGAGSPHISFASSFLRFAPQGPPSAKRSYRQPYAWSDGDLSPSINHRLENDHSALPYQNTRVRQKSELEKPDQGTQKYFQSGGTIGRNSQFHSLTIAERERLGGVEYRAVLLLEFIVPIYFVVWQLLGCVSLGAWVALNATATTLQNGLNPWWIGAFNAVSAFNNSGMSLLDANMIGNSSLTSLPVGTRVIDGLFQAIAVRSGGFYVVNIAELRIGLLVLYAIMMYISVYPVVITMRNSNVYEERSLGIYAEDPMETREVSQANLLGSFLRRLTHRQRSSSAESREYFIRQQLRGQLAYDLWWIVLAVLFITIAETGQFEADPVSYSVFNIVFEVISAYGCVGISVGLPGVAYSFCGGWHVISKLILCAVMIRGRHRGLPVAIDRAVLLPGEHLGAAEEEDAQIRRERTLSRAPTMTPGV
ncbi:hypothetical protein MMC26_000379 [Xylographa opegraphella]|nr:hypothetical protein [Xylographa opegraphella]